MTPVPIEDEEVWEEHHRLIIAGPDGDLTGDIRPVEALRDANETTFSMKIALEPGDLEALAEHGHFWLTILGRQLQPFSLAIPGRFA